MLSSFIFLSLSAAALALPNWGPWQENGPYGPNCLQESQVQTILTGYTSLLQYPQGADFNKTAASLLSDSFFVASDSINTLAGYPLGVNAYPSKQTFIAGQAQTPAIPGLATIAYFYNCGQIAWRWNGTQIGSNKLRINGMIMMDVSPASTQINAVYSEFNTAAWLTDIGDPECQQKQ